MSVFISERFSKATNDIHLQLMIEDTLKAIDHYREVLGILPFSEDLDAADNEHIDKVMAHLYFILDQALHLTPLFGLENYFSEVIKERAAYWKQHYDEEKTRAAVVDPVSSGIGAIKDNDTQH